MSIDRTVILAQKRELDSYADVLAEIHTGLVRYKNSLNQAWQASEIDRLNEEILQLNRRISRVKDEMNDIGTAMVRAAEDIAAEEAARAEAERRAAEAKETERKAAMAEKEAAMEESKAATAESKAAVETAEDKNAAQQKAVENIMDMLQKLWGCLK